MIFSLPVLAQRVREDPSHWLLPLTAAAKAGRAADATSSITAKDLPSCNHSTISCGQTVTGGLATDDCRLDDGSYIDFWKFQGTAGQDVTVTLRSTSFDTYLFLLDPSPEVAVEDDDSGGGSDSQLSYTLDENGEWSIGANSLLPSQIGSYTVTLSCVNGGAPGTPAAPSNLQATVISETRVSLTWADNANDETGFAIDVKTGSAFKEIGSVRVDSRDATIDGLSPNTNYVFRVRARNANGTSAPSNEASVTTRGGVSLISEDFPDFRFQVRIFNQNAPEPLVGRKEASCLPETLCVSGAIPGRSEVMVRIVGPRPNGHLWPTIVRLTSSKVEVQIEQVSTGAVKTYVLDAASPEADELNGLQDRTGFRP
ncbi:MAG TPA: fibronectin type III domain-containing protein [Thermoanaerobaculia bacterium]|nr:fibronectin type III domain-containing protein [Thermoanaerobaculia bacterium]